MITECIRHHDMTDPANVYTTKRGKRHCKTCRRERMRARRGADPATVHRPGLTPRRDDTELLVYFIADEASRVKIGVAYNVPHRLADLQCGNADELTLLGTLPGGYAVEHALHARHADAHIRGEWFKLTLDIRAEMVMT